MATERSWPTPPTSRGRPCSLDFDAARLRVTGRGEPPEDVPKVQDAMRSERVLDAARFPTVRFRSERVQGSATGPGVYELTVDGPAPDPRPHRDRGLPGDGGRAKRAAARHRPGPAQQSDFGIKPVSVAGWSRSETSWSWSSTSRGASALEAEDGRKGHTGESWRL